MKFSIIIPTFNRELLLKRALLSVIAQDYTHWEVIVVDDGGSDGTKTMVEGLSDARIQYFWKENEERGVARNYGVRKATGDYVFFLDSDDLIFPNHLINAYNQLKALGQPEFFSSRYQEWYPSNKTSSPLLNQLTVQDKIKHQNIIGIMFFLRRDVALAFPFSDDRNILIGEDWLLLLKLAARFKLNISNEYTTAIVHHEHRSVNMATPPEILQSRDLIIEQLKEDIAISDKTTKHVYSDLTSLAALAASIHGEKRLSLKLLRKALISNAKLLFKKRTYATLKKVVFGK